MSTIAQVARAYKEILVDLAANLARPSKYTLRAAKLTGEVLTQTLVCGWQAHPEASLHELAQVAAQFGVAVSPQGLDARFNVRTATFLHLILEAAIKKLVAIEGDTGMVAPLLARFNGVYLQDSTVIPLPVAVQAQWPGHGNNRSEPTAGIRVQVRMNFTTGWIDQLCLQACREQDRAAPVQAAPLPARSLHIADLGYFKLPTLRAHDERGTYFISRLRAGTIIMAQPDQPLSIKAFLRRYAPADQALDMAIYVGQREQLPCRLVAWPVPPTVAAQRRRRICDHARKQQRPPNPETLDLAEWTIFVTNAPIDLLAPSEIELLARVRWQIELLFKRWKSLGKLTTSASHKPWRIVCEVYAKLLGLFCQHWLLMTVAWSEPVRSYWQAMRFVRTFAIQLGCLLYDHDRMIALMTVIRSCLATTAKVNKRRKKPSNSQLIMRGLA